jgi:putative ABC transport system substrate-binding protein
MRRRAFIAGLGGAAAWPVVARGQQQKPVIGYLSSTSPGPFAQNIAALQAGLKEGRLRGRSERRN